MSFAAMDFTHGAVSFGTGLITGGMNAIAGGGTLLSDASHIHNIIVKLCGGKPHAQFERGLYGNGPAVTLVSHYNLPMKCLLECML